MSIIKDVTLNERNTLFVPDEIRVALMCESRFNFMENKELCKNYATDIYKLQM